MAPKSKKADAKIQFNVGIDPWDLKLVKAIAWRTGNKDQSNVGRFALLTGLLAIAGGSVQAADALIKEWESSTQDDDKEPDETKLDGTEPKH